MLKITGPAAPMPCSFNAAFISQMLPAKDSSARNHRVRKNFMQ
jgi:hypothetical protein